MLRCMMFCKCQWATLHDFIRGVILACQWRLGAGCSQLLRIASGLRLLYGKTYVNFPSHLHITIARQSGWQLSGPVLRDTARLSQRYPPIARYGVFGVPTWPFGCDTPSPFLSVSPLGEHAKWRCDTPPPLKRGISAILARHPMKTMQMGAIPPLCDTISKGYCAI